MSAPATLSGFAAILLWSTLATLTSALPGIPPFQMAALSFALAALVGAVYCLATGARLATFAAVPLGAWALGVYGLLGYHVCYFAAFRLAPALEVNLVNYLWPLLIVLFSGLLPARIGGRELRWWHVAGALMGFAGTVLLFIAGDSRGGGGSALGYLAALAAALIWSSYSVATRFYAAVPTATVTGTCALTAIGALAGHLALESTAWPATPAQWSLVLAQGLGPVGVAFYLWDAGMKRGNIRLIGVLSYATPLLSTLLLAAAGFGQLSAVLWLSALLVTGGALLAGSDVWRGTSAHRT